jgi:hypothetical protein
MSKLIKGAYRKKGKSKRSPSELGKNRKLGRKMVLKKNNKIHLKLKFVKLNSNLNDFDNNIIKLS